MEKTLYTFTKNGYDDFIDFIKGLAIVLVVLEHTIPFRQQLLFPIWGASKAVPIFLVIQMFHAFKRGQPRIPNVKKVFDRILKPFIIIQVLLLIVNIAVSADTINMVIYKTLRGGGMGPGSYYPWIYIQFALILPFMYKALNRYDLKKLFIICLAMSFAIEVLCSLIDMPERLYRVLALRYMFLVYFGIEWCRKGIYLSNRGIILGTIGLCAVIFFNYFYAPLEPLFFETGWKSDRWITFLFVMYIYVPVIYLIYQKLSCKIVKIFKHLGKASFEIFLCQMFICHIIKPDVVGHFIDNPVFKWLLYLVLTIPTSIYCGLYWYKTKTKAENAGNNNGKKQ